MIAALAKKYLHEGSKTASIPLFGGNIGALPICFSPSDTDRWQADGKWQHLLAIKVD